MNAVELRDVTKRFGKVVAVDNLSLDVPRGSIYGFIGPNGSGKTTTLRMIMNIFYPDSGRIEVLGGLLHGTCTDRIGYLPEERGLYKRMGVRDLLKFYGRLKSGHNVARQVDTWLERFDLADWGKKKVETLSKGMSQKVQFIAAVVAEPELIVLAKQPEPCPLSPDGPKLIPARFLSAKAYRFQQSSSLPLFLL